MSLVLSRTHGCVLTLGLLCGATVCPLSAATLYVATDGNDAWSGKLARPDPQDTDGPLATLAGARNMMRRWKAQGPLNEAVYVQVAAGIYPLRETLVFEPQDSGTADAPIIYQAATGARPVITGGRNIQGFVPDEKGRWKVHLPDVASGKWYFEDLYVNGHRAIRARSPNEFYYYVRSKAKATANPDNGKTELMPHRSFVADLMDIAPLAALPKAQLSDAIVVAPYNWECSVARVASVDPSSGTVVLTGNVFLPCNVWKRNHRYHIENIKAALDAPGEWFLERTGDLYYIPRSGEDMQKAEVIAPVLTELVRFAGDPQKGQSVEHITLGGLSFQHNRYPMPPQGHCDIQGAVETTAAIMADGAQYIVLEDNEVAHVGAYAVWFRRGCQDCRVQRCLIQDMAAGGVRIGQGWYNDHNMSWNTVLIRPGSPKNGPNPLLPYDATGHCIVDNNIIRSGGHLFRSAVGVWIGHSAYNQVTHNDVGDFRYTGISVGWRWQLTPPSEAHHNKIEFNHVHHIGGGVLTDMGGVYLIGGPCPGTIVRNNVIHDVYASDYGGWGLYNDEGCTGSLLETNLVYNTKSGGYHINNSNDNIVCNNILAFGLEAQLSRTSGNTTFSNNIVYWTSGSLFNKDSGGSWKDAGVQMANNLYFNASGAAVKFADMDLAAWQALGKDAGSIVADPKFVDPSHFDFRLQPDSPAGKIGFKPFDYAQAGVYGRDAWIKEAASIQYPPLRLPPPPSPVRPQGRPGD